MWSDRTPLDRLQTLAAGLPSVLPAPSPQALVSQQSLSPRPSIEQVAELLHDDPRFTWMNGRIFHRPLATVSYAGGQGVITGPDGTVTLRAHGFELLDAMMDAWGGP